MKIEVEKYRFQKVKEEGFCVEMPEEPVYFFEYGYRVSFGVFPKWTTWNKEEYNKPEAIYAYDIIAVDTSSNKTELSFLPLIEVSSIYNRPSSNDSIQTRVVRHLVDSLKERMVRTQEEFLKDFNHVYKKYYEVFPKNVKAVDYYD